MDVMKKKPRNQQHNDSLRDSKELSLVVKGETELLKYLVDSVPAKRRNTIKAVVDAYDGTIKLYISERGKIIPRRITGTCAKHQRSLTTSIKRARNIALIPFAAGQ